MVLWLYIFFPPTHILYLWLWKLQAYGLDITLNCTSMCFGCTRWRVGSGLGQGYLPCCHWFFPPYLVFNVDLSPLSYLNWIPPVFPNVLLGFSSFFKISLLFPPFSLFSSFSFHNCWIFSPCFFRANFFPLTRFCELGGISTPEDPELGVNGLNKQLLKL